MKMTREQLHRALRHLPPGSTLALMRLKPGEHLLIETKYGTIRGSLSAGPTSQAFVLPTPDSKCLGCAGPSGRDTHCQWCGRDRRNAI